MRVVEAYERCRGADPVNVSSGGDPRLSATIESLGIERPRIPSADFISTARAEVRIIEVKGRGGKGPVEALAREVETLTKARDHGWLYVVWNTTQPSPLELWLVNDPGRLPWEAKVTSEPPASEARFMVTAGAIEAFGSRANLQEVEGLPESDG